MGHLLFWGIHCKKLVNFKQSGQKLLSGQYFSMTSTNSLTMTFDHLTLKSIRVIYSLGAFGNLQAKGLKDIERTSLRLQTDRPTGAERGGIVMFKPNQSLIL